MNTKVLGLIGTAGRGSDSAALDVATMGVMKGVAQSFVKLLKVDAVVSGGAAWADFLAIHLYANGLVDNLILHLPCPFDTRIGRFDDQYDTGRALNHYHQVFEDITGHSSLHEMSKVLLSSPPETLTVTYPHNLSVYKGFGGFFERNTSIALTADIMLAYTYGEKGKPDLKSGGTKDTMDKYLARRGERGEPKPLMTEGVTSAVMYEFIFEAPAYHFNLADRVIYQL